MYNLQLTEISKPNKQKNVMMQPKFFGSSLQRPKKEKPINEDFQEVDMDFLNELIQNLSTNDNNQETESESTKNDSLQDTRKKLHSLSTRSKRKIRNKCFHWFDTCSKDTTFTFLTLSFINHVDDKTATKCLNDFFNIVRKDVPSFEYLWVIERQKKNKDFPDNPHFHILNNHYWDIAKFNRIWINVQQKHGIVNPIGKVTENHSKHLNPFDIKKVKDVRKLTVYITKYVTKNADEYGCRTWGCSRGISALFTGVRVSASQVDELLSNLQHTSFITRSGSMVSYAWHFTDYAQIHKLANPHLLLQNRLFEQLRQFNKMAYEHQRTTKDSELYVPQILETVGTDFSFA